MIEKIVHLIFPQARKKKRGSGREIESEICVVEIQIQWLTNRIGKK